MEGVLSFTGLKLHKAGTVVPRITPRNPEVSLDEWVRNVTSGGSADTAAAPGQCDSLKVVAGTAYEMCMGSLLGVPEIQDDSIVRILRGQSWDNAPSYSSSTGLLNWKACSRACNLDPRCR